MDVLYPSKTLPTISSSRRSAPKAAGDRGGSPPPQQCHLVAPLRRSRRARTCLCVAAANAFSLAPNVSEWVPGRGGEVRRGERGRSKPLRGQLARQFSSWPRLGSARLGIEWWWWWGSEGSSLRLTEPELLQTPGVIIRVQPANGKRFAAIR